jgi:hypothetical protein
MSESKVTEYINSSCVAFVVKERHSAMLIKSLVPLWQIPILCYSETEFSVQNGIISLSFILGEWRESSTVVTESHNRRKWNQANEEFVKVYRTVNWLTYVV